MPGKAKWKWQWIDYHTTVPHPPSLSLSLCRLLGVLPARLAGWQPSNCPCFTWLSNIMANYLTFRILKQPSPHFLLHPSLHLPSSGSWFIWLRRLLLVTWWVDASETSGFPIPSLSIVRFSIPIVSASILIPIFVTIFVFIAHISLPIVLIYVMAVLCSIVAPAGDIHSGQNWNSQPGIGIVSLSPSYRTDHILLPIFSQRQQLGQVGKVGKVGQVGKSGFFCLQRPKNIFAIFWQKV